MDGGDGVVEGMWGGSLVCINVNKLYRVVFFQTFFQPDSKPV